MILNNLPALPVLVPLLAAPVCSLLMPRRLAWLFSALVTLITFVCATELLRQVYIGGTISYSMGNWAAPFGIEYRIDSLSAMFLAFVSGVALFSIIYALPSVEKEIKNLHQPFFYTLYLLLLAGLLGIASTNDLFNIYVFLEISSLATYALIAMGKDRRALIAAFEYLILGTIGATFILIAIGIVYAMTGSLNISDVAVRIKPTLSNTPIKMAVAFFTIGLAMKIAIFPLHLWLTNSYTNAPSFITVFLSATATKISIYVLIRLLFFVFGKEFSFATLPIGHILIILGILGMVIGSIVAIMQDNIKRMLAYSSVAQIGYIILGIGIANIQGITSSLLHIIFHGIAKAAMFMAAGAILLSTKSVRLESIGGIGKLMPLTMAVFVISGLSLIGIPGTAGFISKWYLLQATITSGMWPVFASVIFTSLLTLIYIWRVVEVAYFKEADFGKNNIPEAPLPMLLAMFVLAVITLVLGVFPGYLNLYIGNVAAGLFGV